MNKKVFYDLDDKNFYLMELSILDDGFLKINGEKFDIEELKDRIQRQQIRTSLPKNSRFNIHAVGYKFLVDEESWTSINEIELIKEIQDNIAKMNGQPSSADLCMAAFKNFLLDFEKEELRKNLEEAYLSVPTHNRMFILGDMDSKDYPIRWAIDNSVPKDSRTINAYYQEYFGRFE